jgi:hypothetical protein
VGSFAQVQEVYNEFKRGLNVSSSQVNPFYFKFSNMRLSRTGDSNITKE